MKKIYPALCLLSLLLNIYFLYELGESNTSHNMNYKKANSEWIKNNKEVKRKDAISDDTTMFVLNFSSHLTECDKFLWTVSEHPEEIKYTIWFAK
jgi:hypothetical protein